VDGRRAPFFLDEHGDLELFTTEVALLDYVEEGDVLSGEYEVWDSLGQPFRIDLTLNSLVMDSRSPAVPRSREWVRSSLMRKGVVISISPVWTTPSR